MKKNVIIGVIIAVAVIIAAIAGFKAYQANLAKNGTQRACTMEAKVCPDGSAVGRTGPNCEFAACPAGGASGETKAKLSETEARVIAEKTCIKGGEALAAGTYNENSQTWWFDANLNATRPGCSPACVVSEETNSAEINWRCTGAIPPPKGSTGETLCPAKNKDAQFCAQIYDPVCATVEIQCIKAPCYPIQQTFGNACEACLNSLVKKYILGECKK